MSRFDLPDDAFGRKLVGWDTWTADEVAIALKTRGHPGLTPPECEACAQVLNGLDVVVVVAADDNATQRWHSLAQAITLISYEPDHDFHKLSVVRRKNERAIRHRLQQYGGIQVAVGCAPVDP